MNYIDVNCVRIITHSNSHAIYINIINIINDYMGGETSKIGGARELGRCG